MQQRSLFNSACLEDASNLCIFCFTFYCRVIFHCLDLVFSQLLVVRTLVDCIQFVSFANKVTVSRYV